jgi:hypothetical protein
MRSPKELDRAIAILAKLQHPRTPEELRTAKRLVGLLEALKWVRGDEQIKYKFATVLDDLERLQLYTDKLVKVNASRAAAN